MQTNIAIRIGAMVIVPDIYEPRLELAKEFDVDYTTNPAKENVVKDILKIIGRYSGLRHYYDWNLVVIKQSMNVPENYLRIVPFGGASARAIMRFNSNDIHCTKNTHWRYGIEVSAQ